MLLHVSSLSGISWLWSGGLIFIHTPSLGWLLFSKAVVNMGPTSPPQRKGMVPQYSQNKLVELQDEFDELEDDFDVFASSDEVGVAVEYLDPSFLVNLQEATVSSHHLG